MSKAKRITTPSMRRVPAVEARMIEGGVNPTHEKIQADGWNKLREILEEAMQNNLITASSGASGFLEFMHGIAADPSTLTADSNVTALQPFIDFTNASLKKKNDELLGKLKAKK